MGQIITDDALEPYIDDVLNELEVKLSRLPQSAPANGCSTFSLIQTHGELRASHGFPELSPVTHVQIGNEDHLWGGGPSYGERFTRFHDATKTPAHHHHQRPRVPSKPKPAGSGWTTTRTTRQMRWLANSTCSTMSTGHCRISLASLRALPSRGENGFPIMQTSVAEAVFMIGIERNSDIVKMAAYPPLLEHADGDQWSVSFPDIITVIISRFLQCK